MTSEEQDKLWAELSEKEKTYKQKEYQELSESQQALDKGALCMLVEIFGEHNLQPVLTYLDVSRELFKGKTRYVFGEHGLIKEYNFSNCGLGLPLNFTSEKQAKKLAAINKLLNVAKFLNKNEDGTDWEPNFKNKDEKHNKIWCLGFDEDEDKIRAYYADLYGARSEFVYFRTEKLAQQAVQILGEDVVRTALTTDY